MKKIVSLVLVMCLSLCACGGSDNSSQSTVSTSTTKPTQANNSPVETVSAGYADNAFSFEEVGYEIDSLGVIICFKFRNISDKHLDRASFTVQMLDVNGDVIDTKHIGYIDGIDAGQAVWYELRTDDTKECSTINELSDRIDSFKIVSLYATLDDSDNYGYYNLDFKNPIVIKVVSIGPKN